MNNKIISILILVILGISIFYFANSYEAPFRDSTQMQDAQDGTYGGQKPVESTDQNSTSTMPQAKINIDEVCEGALAYMSFPDGEAAEKFVADCKDGKHPEVIRQYIVDMNLGTGAQI
jgi:hypothetical protein